MTQQKRKTPLQYLTIGLWLLSNAAVAQNLGVDQRLPMSFDAETTNYDGKTSTFIFTGLRLSQGPIDIQADEGRSKRLELEDNSIWQLHGNVVINVENGHIECDSADLEFDEFRLKLVVVIGSPATFELQRPGNDDVTYAEAGKLAYDVDNGIIEFSEQVTITEGGNQIASNFLIYNIPEQTISAESSGAEDDRVRIIYTPTEADNAADDTTPATPEEEDENP